MVSQLFQELQVYLVKPLVVHLVDDLDTAKGILLIAQRDADHGTGRKPGPLVYVSRPVGIGLAVKHDGAFAAGNDLSGDPLSKSQGKPAKIHTAPDRLGVKCSVSELVIEPEGPRRGVGGLHHAVQRDGQGFFQTAGFLDLRFQQRDGVFIPGAFICCPDRLNCFAHDRHLSLICDTVTFPGKTCRWENLLRLLLAYAQHIIRCFRIVMRDPQLLYMGGLGQSAALLPCGVSP